MSLISFEIFNYFHYWLDEGYNDFDSIVLLKQEISHFDILCDSYSKFDKHYIFTFTIAKRHNLYKVKFRVRNHATYAKPLYFELTLNSEIPTDMEKIQFLKTNKKTLLVPIKIHKQTIQEAYNQTIYEFVVAERPKPTKIEGHYDCVICFERDKLTYNSKLFSCTHIEFCADCLDKLIEKTNAKCPLCRADFLLY